MDCGQITDLQDFSDKILKLANSIKNSDLKPWFKLDALWVFIYSKLHFLMRVGSLRLLDLKLLDQELKSILCKSAGLPTNTLHLFIEGPSCCGCLGFPSLLMWRAAHVIANFAHTMNDQLSPISRIARAVIMRITRTNNIEQAVDYILENALKTRYGRPIMQNTHWSAIIVATRTFTNLMEFKLIAPKDTVHVLVGLKGESSHPLPDQQLFRNLCLSIHRVTFAGLLATSRGPVFKHLSSCSTSIFSIKSGWLLNSHEWKLMLRARLDLLSLPTRQHRGFKPGLCRHCLLYPDSLTHALSLCKPRESLIIKRHDLVLWRLVRALLSTLSLTDEESAKLEKMIPTERLYVEIREGLSLYVNHEFEYWDMDKRPDLIFIDNVRKIAYVIDVQVVVEYASHSFDVARSEKVSKYQELAVFLQNRGLTVFIDAFLMGALGSFDPKNMLFLNLLKLPPLHLEYFIRFLCSKMVQQMVFLYHSYIV